MKAMVSALPTDKKESIPYVQMGTHAARNSYHPYATPYASYTNKMQYSMRTPNYALPGNTFSNRSPPCVNRTSPASFSTSPVGFNNVSPIGFNGSSPPSFNTTSPNVSSYNVSSSSYSSVSPTSYSNVSPTNFTSLNVDTSFGNNVDTSQPNATQNSYGMQGNGYSYQVPQNSLLMPCYGLSNANSTGTTSMGYRSNYAATPNVTPSWNEQNVYGSNGNHYNNANIGLLNPAMPSSDNSCVYSC